MALCTHSQLVRQTTGAWKKSGWYSGRVRFKLADSPIPDIGGCRTFGLKFNQLKSQQ